MIYKIEPTYKHKFKIVYIVHQVAIVPNVKLTDI